MAQLHVSYKRLVVLSVLFIWLMVGYLPAEADDSVDQLNSKIISRGDLRDIAYSPDGDQLFALTQQSVWLYDDDHPDGQMIYEQFVSPLWDFDISPDGSLIALGSRDAVVRLFSVAERRIVGALSVNSTDEVAFDVVFSPDKKALAVSYPGHLRIWDVERQTLIASRETSGGSSHGLVFSSDGSYLAQALCCDVVKIWDMPDFTLRYEVPTDGMVNGLSFIPDTHQLMVIDETRTVRIWRPNIGIDVIPDILITGPIALSSDGTSISAYTDRQLHILEFKDDSISLVDTADISHIDHMVFSPTGEQIAVLSDDTFGHGYQLLTVDLTNIWVTELPGIYTGFVEDIVISPGGKVLMSIHALSGTRLWTVDGDLVYQIDTDGVRVASDWSIMVTVERGILISRDPMTGEQIASLEDSDTYWYWIELAPTGDYVAGLDSDYRLHVWDIWTGEVLGTVNAGYLANRLIFTPDGEEIISEQADPTTLRIWNAEDVELLKRVTIRTEARFTDFSISPNGQILAASLAGVLPVTLLRDATSLESIDSLSGHTGWIETSAFSPDSRLLATGARDGTVRIWDVDTRQEVLLIDKHTDWITEVAFSPDGEILAVASYDGTVSLWDMNTMSEFTTLTQHSDQVFSIAFFPDSQALATGGRDGAIKVVCLSASSEAC